MAEEIIFSPDNIKEIDAIYCLLAVSDFKEIEFRKLVLANFLLKYPHMLQKISIPVDLSEEEKNSVMVNEDLRFNDSWDKNTVDGLRILIAKDLVEFKNDGEDIIKLTSKTDIAYKKIAKFEDFDKVRARVNEINRFFHDKTVEEIKGRVNG